MRQDVLWEEVDYRDGSGCLMEYLEMWKDESLCWRGDLLVMRRGLAASCHYEIEEHFLRSVHGPAFRE